jgi:hypothetical protein
MKTFLEILKESEADKILAKYNLSDLFKDEEEFEPGIEIPTEEMPYDKDEMDRYVEKQVRRLADFASIPETRANAEWYLSLSEEERRNDRVTKKGKIVKSKNFRLAQDITNDLATGMDTNLKAKLAAWHQYRVDNPIKEPDLPPPPPKPKFILNKKEKSNG